MAIKKTVSCRRIEAAMRLLVRRDGPHVDRHLFLHSLPHPVPTEKDEILDLILQLILLLLNEFKPDNDDNGNDNDTNFPDLAKQARDLARQHVETSTLERTARLLAATINGMIVQFQAHPPESIRIAREAIRQANHDALKNDDWKWSDWNEEIRGLLDGYADQDLLDTLTSYLDAWSQISKGLKNIA